MVLEPRDLPLDPDIREGHLQKLPRLAVQLGHGVDPLLPHTPLRALRKLEAIHPALMIAEGREGLKFDTEAKGAYNFGIPAGTEVVEMAGVGDRLWGAEVFC